MTLDAATIHRRRWLTLAVLCLSLFLVVVDNTILNVAIPTLVRDLGASNSELQWIVDAYTLVFAGLLLTAGSLGDRFGRRSALTVGLLIFAFGSAMAGEATSASALIAWRSVMGLGGALIMPATLSILTNVFTDRKERAQAIALWAGVSGLAVAFGPLTGGWLLEHFWWGSIFYVNLPVIAIALVAGWFLVPNSRDPEAPRLDPIGAVLSVVGLVALVYGFIEAPERGWTNGVIVGAFALAAVVLGTFVAWELRREQPMLDMRFFANPRFSAASLAVTALFFGMFGSVFLISQYLQFVLDYSALQAGVHMLPVAGAIFLSTAVSAKAAERFGTKAIVTLGLVLAATGLFIVTSFSATGGYGPVALSMVVLGTGMGLAMAPATESIMGSLPPAKAGVGSAVNDTTREIGGALGVAVIGSMLSSTYGARMSDALAGQPIPDEAATVIKEGLGGALAVAQQLGGSTGDALASAARQAFVDGLGRGVIVAGSIILLGALVALIALPARGAETSPATEPVDEDPDGLPEAGVREPVTA